MLQISLHGEINIPPIVKSDALNVLELTAESRDSFQFFAGVVNIELAVSAVGYVQRSSEVKKSLGRKRVPMFDESVQCVIRVEQVENIVFIVADVKVALIV